jgi:hypothetical protein
VSRLRGDQAVGWVEPARTAGSALRLTRSRFPSSPRLRARRRELVRVGEGDSCARLEQHERQGGHRRCFEECHQWQFDAEVVLNYGYHACRGKRVPPKEEEVVMEADARHA